MVNLSGVLLLFLLRTSLCIRLDQFYPFGATEADGQVPPGDDNFSPSISLPKQFLFFGENFSSLFVSVIVACICDMTIIVVGKHKWCCKF